MIRGMRRALAALAVAAVCGGARAGWRHADLPYSDYIIQPVTGVACAGSRDVWATAPYSYANADGTVVRWNTQLYHSENDGLLWDLPFDAPGNDPTPNAHLFQDVQLFAVSFANGQDGWLFGRRRPTFGRDDPPGDYAFYHTTDGGRSWTEATLPGNSPATDDSDDYAMDAVDATHCVAVHGRHVFETSDGVTWTERAGAWPRMNAVQARGLPAPRVAGEDGGRAVSGVLGANGFVPDAVTGLDGAFHAVRFVDAARGWLAGGGGAAGFVLSTDDGGAHWTTALTVPGVVFHGVAAPEAGAARASGSPDDGLGGVVYATDDGGATWRLELASPGALLPVVFPDAHRGFTGGVGGLYRFVPGAPAPGDRDDNGQADGEDAAALLRMAAGLRTAAAGDADAAPVTVASVVSVLRQIRGAAPPSDDRASRALVVYNTISADADGDGMGDSEEVARYYAMRRGIADDHLVPVSWPDPNAFTAHAPTRAAPRANWTDCFHAIVEPLRSALAALGRDTVDTIVFTYGVPYQFDAGTVDGASERLTVDQSLNDLYAVDEDNWCSASPYAAPFTGAPERYGKSRFGEGGRPLGEPFVDASGAVTRGPFYLTGRVDGPGVAACEAMVDNALFAEQYHGPGGYEGTAYVDTRAAAFNIPTLQPYSLPDLRDYAPVYQDYTTYDRSIARAIITFADRGYPWRDEITYDAIGQPGASPTWRDGTPATNAPRAMFYAGWYNYGQYNDVWDWLPGSVGVDFDSASAYGFRTGSYFAGGALNAGLSALVGVLDEPYNYHPKPDALMEYLARGFTLGEAAMLATDTPRTARAITLGDPLYRPFAPHPPRAVPLPTVTFETTDDAAGLRVTLESDIPVKAVLRYTLDGSDPGPDSALAEASPRFYARRHAFLLPDAPGLRFAAEVTDATGRVTDARP
jgi:uncharacterized protein (TIGR03790 family)